MISARAGWSANARVPDCRHVDVHLDAIQPRALLDELEIGARSRPDVIRLDLSQLADIDVVGVATLRAARRRLESLGIDVELAGASPKVAHMLHDTPAVTAHEHPPAPGVLEQVGQASLSIWRAAVALADMTFEMTFGLFAAIFGRASFSIRDVLDQVERIGADSVIIVSSLSFLLGLVLAFQAWVQLHSFGTEQWVLEFTGIGMARGLAPFIVAVLVSARTGSAIAAELATMEMRQENDALRVMGISPVRHLVIPRMLALTVVMPALGLIATAAGTAGGFVVTLAQSPNWFAALQRLLNNLTLADLWLGTVKCVLFGWVIGLASTFTGFNSGSGAVSIGLAATRGVVSSIFVIMVVDAIVTTIWTIAQ
jgi:phospholipid/cholesterol/gamma-HCH transport system permease protein